MASTRTMIAMDTSRLRWIVRTCLVGLAALTTTLAATPAPAQPVDPGAGSTRPHVIEPELRHTLATADAGEQVDFLVSIASQPDLEALRSDRAAVVAQLRQHADRSQQPVIDHLRAQDAEVLNRFWLANLLLVRSDAATATELTALAEVAAIRPVATLAAPELEPAVPDDAGVATVGDRTWGVDRIGAHRVWDELGLDGAGVRVAVLDTGVRQQHPDLAGKLATDDPADPHYPGGWMEWDPDGQPVAGQPRDSQQHGTHVSGTVVGGDAGGTHIGVAPGAQLMHGMVLPGGSGTTPQVIAGMQWALDPYDHSGDPAGEPAQVVNMSFAPQTGGINELLVEPIRNLRMAGVVPVAAAGNCGEDCHGSPGNIYEALSVGATDRDDDVADFSSGGELTPGDWSDPPPDWPQRWTVPGLSAPGVDVLSSIPASLGPPYGATSGTSMAAPHVAGAAALMLSGDPQLQPDALAAALVDTAFFDGRYGDQRPNTRFGYGRIDAYQAVSRVVLDTGISGEVLDAGTGAPVPGVAVEVVEASVSTRTTEAGTFEFRLPPGTYTLELSWSDRTVSTVTGAVVDDATTAVRVELPGVSGQVTDAGNGVPVTAAQVSAADTGVAVTTGRDGSYRLYLRPGDYDLQATAFGYAEPAPAAVTVADSEFSTADLSLAELPTGKVTGRVTFVDSGLGVPGVDVALASGARSATTTVDGSYTITDVPVGEHELVAHPELFHQPAAVDVAVAGEETAEIDFPLECGAECAGQWVSRYRGPANGRDSAAAAVVDPDGSRVFVTGSSTGVGTDQDFATIAYDTATGQQLWEARYDGPVSRQDGGNAITVSPDGSRVFVTGLSLGRGVSGSGADYATVAYDAANGQELWVARYNGPGDAFDNPRAVDISPDGSRVFVTGQSRAAGEPTHSEYATIAYDTASGHEQWVARYDGPSSGFDSAHDLVVSPDGRLVLVTGASPGNGSGGDYATVAYNTGTGAQVWVARYDGPANANDRASAIAMTPDGSRVVVTGRSGGVGTSADYATVAYDPADGSQLWAGRYSGPGSSVDAAAAVAASPDSSTIYVTGESRAGAGSDTTDYATAAYDALDGSELWVARYAGPGDDSDRARAVVPSPDGTQVVVTGGSQGDGTEADFATVAYDPADGDEMWVARYDGPASDADHANAAAFTADGDRLFVTGRSALGIGEDPVVAPSDYATVAYDARGGQQSPVLVAHEVSADPDVAIPGVPVQVRGLVTNVGTGAGSYAATLVVDGAADQTTTVSLQPGETTEVRWALQRDEPGDYPLRVGHASAALRVAACDTVLTGAHHGPLTVSDGITCLTEGAQVRGAVTVTSGAGLVAHGADLTGRLRADNASMLDLRQVRVTGRVTVTDSTGHVHVSGSQIKGVVTIMGHIGDAPPMIAGNRIRGTLSCDRNLPAPVDGGTPNQVTGRTAGQCAAL